MSFFKKYSDLSFEFYQPEVYFAFLVITDVEGEELRVVFYHLQVCGLIFHKVKPEIKFKQTDFSSITYPSVILTSRYLKNVPKRTIHYVVHLK